MTEDTERVFARAHGRRCVHDACDGGKRVLPRPRMHDVDTPLDVLRARLVEFNGAREWARFHNPKDLATALTVEAGELLELFLWRRPDTSDLPDRQRLEAECADVLICLVNLANATGIDLMAAAEQKLAHNALKYPVEKARGNAKKYDDL